MLSIQNMHLSNADEDSALVHAGTRRSPRAKASKTRRNAMIYGGLAAGATAAALGGYHVLSKPGVRKKLGKLGRKVRAKVTSRVRTIRRGSAAKVVGGPGKFLPAYKKRGMKVAALKRKTRLNPGGLPVKRGVLGYPVHVRKSRPTTGLGYGKYAGTYGRVPRSLIGSKTRRVSSAKRSLYKRTRK